MDKPLHQEISQPRSSPIYPKNNTNQREKWFGSVLNNYNYTSFESKIINNETNDYSQRGRCEVDTQENTMCADSMFKLIKTTGQLFIVTGFRPDLPSIKDKPNSTTATDYYHSVILTYILTFPPSLYFGRRLEN